MLITHLGLRPCLKETGVPPALQAQQDVKMLKAIDQRIRQSKKARKIRRKLKAVLSKVDAAVSAEK